jgi:hypothetical protein
MKREEGLFTVYGFDSTHDALRAEKTLLASGVTVALIPTPRALGSLCGFAVRVPESEERLAGETLEAARIEPNGVIQIGDRSVG